MVVKATRVVSSVVKDTDSISNLLLENVVVKSSATDDVEDSSDEVEARVVSISLEISDDDVIIDGVETATLGETVIMN